MRTFLFWQALEGHKLTHDQFLHSIQLEIPIPCHILSLYLLVCMKPLNYYFLDFFSLSSLVFVWAQGIEGTGLAFIAFTEVMAFFPASPFWSTLFFLMLLNLGLSTMFGTMQGILTPLMDNFSFLGRHRTLLTGNSCTQKTNTCLNIALHNRHFEFLN